MARCRVKKYAIIGHDNPGWDHFISMNKDQNFFPSSAKIESTSYNGDDNNLISTSPTNADPTVLNK